MRHTDIATMLGKITKGNAVDVLSMLPDNSVDLIFADPPYNLQLQNELWRPNQTRVNGVDDSWDKFASFEEYDNFTIKWLTECKRILKDTGGIWVIGTYHNIFRLGKAIQDLGFWIINDVVWIKSNPMPNFKGTRFTNAHETLIFSVKDKHSRYTFHYRSMKAYNDDLQMRSDWTIPICSGKERIRIDGERAHSTQKPEELLRRVILSTSNPGDIILDPFVGSGTTGVVAKNLGRRFIGIEMEEKYISVAMERICKTKPVPSEYLSYPLEVRKPRVPFGDLVASGLIMDGETLYSESKEFQATVLTNGTVVSRDIQGSIHSVSARILGKPANNGWKFWYVLRDKNMVCIDDLRNELIKKYHTESNES